MARKNAYLYFTTFAHDQSMQYVKIYRSVIDTQESVVNFDLLVIAKVLKGKFESTLI